MDGLESIEFQEIYENTGTVLRCGILFSDLYNFVVRDCKLREEILMKRVKEFHKQTQDNYSFNGPGLFRFWAVLIPNKNPNWFGMEAWDLNFGIFVKDFKIDGNKLLMESPMIVKGIPRIRQFFLRPEDVRGCFLNLTLVKTECKEMKKKIIKNIGRMKVSGYIYGFYFENRHKNVRNRFDYCKV
jgi:hypothetical protein